MSLYHVLSKPSLRIFLVRHVSSASSMMTQQPARVYWLKSFEGQVFEVHEDVSLQSPLVSKQAKEAGGVIQLEGADTRSLRKVIVWCKGCTPVYKVGHPLGIAARVGRRVCQPLPRPRLPPHATRRSKNWRVVCATGSRPRH